MEKSTFRYSSEGPYHIHNWRRHEEGSRGYRGVDFSNSKISIPSFNGLKDPDACLTWIKKVECFFGYQYYTEKEKVKLATSAFKHYALSWWNQFVKEHRLCGLPSIATWDALKRIMLRRYASTYYGELMQKFQSLNQGSKTVVEYFEEMESIMKQAGIEEDLDTTIEQFLDGLKRKIANRIEVLPHMKLRDVASMAIKIERQLQRRKKEVHLTKSMPKNEPHEESWWDIYQRLLHEKQAKEKAESSAQASSNMALVEVVAHEISPKSIQSGVEIEEIIIEAEEWEKEVENELNNVQSVSEHNVKLERSDNEQERALCLSEKMSENFLDMESMVVKTEGVSESVYLSTNDLNFALFSVHYLMQVKQGEVKVFMTCTIPNPVEEVMTFRGIAYLYHHAIEECNALVIPSTTLQRSFQLREVQTEINSFDLDDHAICLHCVNSSSIKLSPFQHYNCLCCESPVLSLYASFIIFESCDHCDSICHACLFSTTSVSLGYDKSFRMMHGVQVFPTCYQLGKFRTYNSFTPTYTSFFVFDPGIDLRSNHFHGGGNDRSHDELCSWLLKHVHWFVFMMNLS